MENPGNTSEEATGAVEDPPPPTTSAQEQSTSESSSQPRPPTERRPPPLSPLTGSYLLIVVGEPHSERHKEIILQKIAKAFLSWDVSECHVSLEKELQVITGQSPEGEEARYGERLIQYATENLVTEILIHPQLNTLHQCLKNLLSSFTKHRHIIHAGYTFAGNGSWILQDGTLSISDLVEALHEPDVLRVLKAYENSVSIDVHCAPEGDWTSERFHREPVSKLCNVRINPGDVMTAGNPAISAFIDYLSPFLEPANIQQLLQPTDVVGNIRFTHPTLYVFPGGQGDAALFGINGFNMLIDGGFARKACFWDFARHLDRLDAVLLTRLNNSTVNGISAVLQRKKMNHVYPQIGHFFCNLQDRKIALSPDGDKDKDSLIVNLAEEGQEIVANLRHLALKPHPCYRDGNQVDPVNLYHKVGHGKLDMYVISPARDSQAVKDFLAKWSSNDSHLFSNTGKKVPGKTFEFPLQNLVSICALLVWQPANPSDTITRILFPGSTPQHKIFEGLEKLRHLEFLKHPVCSAKSISPSVSTTTVTRSLSKTRQPRPADNKQKETKIIAKPQVKTMKPKTEKTPPKEIKSKLDNKLADEKMDLENVEEPLKKLDNRILSKDEQIENIKKEIQKIEQAENEEQKKKIVHRSKYDMRNVKSKVDSRAPSKSIDRKKAPEKKPDGEVSPPGTPKKGLTNGTATRAEKAKVGPKPAKAPSPTSTPAKSAKEANNRKVVEARVTTARSSSKPVPRKKEETPPPPPSAPTKTERKPISRRPKAPLSPAKSSKPKAEPESASKTVERKAEVDAAALAEAVSQTISKGLEKGAETEKTEIEEGGEGKIGIKKLEEETTENKETEIKAVKDEPESAQVEEENKEEEEEEEDEEEEYLIITKEEYGEESAKEDESGKENEEEAQTKDETEGEGEMKKLLREEEESEKKREVHEIRDLKEEEKQENPEEAEQQEVAKKEAEDEEKKEEDQIAEEQRPETPREKSPEARESELQRLMEVDEGIDLKEPVSKEHKEGESLPEEKMSNTLETSATTAPTLPEDERIEEPVEGEKEQQEDVKEVIEEKYIQEKTKEEKQEEAVVEPQQPVAPSTIDVEGSFTPVQTAQRKHPRDVVKTPDEVAELPMHEEVDPRMYASGDYTKELQRKPEEDKPDFKATIKGEANFLDDDASESEESKKAQENTEPEKGTNEIEDPVITKYLNIIDELEKSAVESKKEVKEVVNQEVESTPVQKEESEIGEEQKPEPEPEVVKTEDIKPEVVDLGQTSGRSTPLETEKIVSGKSTPLDLGRETSRKSTPQELEKDLSRISTPGEMIKESSGKTTPIDMEKEASGKSTPQHLVREASGKSTPQDMASDKVALEEPKDSLVQDLERGASGKSTPLERNVDLSGKSTPQDVTKEVSGRSSPQETKKDSTESLPQDLRKEASTPESKVEKEVSREPISKEEILGEDATKSGKTEAQDPQKDVESHEPETDTPRKLSVKDAEPEEISGKSTPAEICKDTSGKSTPQIPEEISATKDLAKEISRGPTPQIQDEASVDSPNIELEKSGKSTPLNLKEMSGQPSPEDSGKSTPKDLDRNIPREPTPHDLEKEIPEKSPPEEQQKDTSGKSTPLIGEVSSPKTTPREEGMSGKSTPQDLGKEISRISTPIGQEQSGKSTPLELGKEASGKSTPQDLAKDVSREPTPQELSRTPLIVTEDASGKSTPQDWAVPDKGTAQNLSRDESQRSTPVDGGEMKKQTSGKTTPEEVKDSFGRTTPAKDISGRTTPAKDISGRTTPAKDISGRTTPAKDISGRTTPEKDISGKTTPATDVPVQSSGKTTPQDSTRRLSTESGKAAPCEDEKSSSRRESLIASGKTPPPPASPVTTQDKTIPESDVRDSEIPSEKPDEIQVISGKDTPADDLPPSKEILEKPEEKVPTAVKMAVESSVSDSVSSGPGEKDVSGKSTPFSTDKEISGKISPPAGGKLTSDSVSVALAEKGTSGTCSLEKETSEKVSSPSPVDISPLSLDELKEEKEKGDKEKEVTPEPRRKSVTETHTKSQLDRVRYEEGASSGTSTPDRSHKSDASLPNGMESEDEPEKGILESERQEKESQLDLSSGEEEELKALGDDDDSETEIRKDDLEGGTISKEIAKEEKEDINKLVKIGAELETEGDVKTSVKRMLVTASSEDGGTETEICIKGGIKIVKEEPSDEEVEKGEEAEEKDEEGEFSNLILQARKEYNAQRSRKTSCNSSEEAEEPEAIERAQEEGGEEEEEEEEEGEEEEEEGELSTLLKQARQELEFVRSKNREMVEGETVKSQRGYETRKTTTTTSQSTRMDDNDIITITTILTEEREEQEDGSFKVTTTKETTTKGGKNEGTVVTVNTNFERKEDRKHDDEESSSQMNSSGDGSGKDRRTKREDGDGKTSQEDVETSRRTSASSIISQEDLVSRKDSAKIEDFRQSSTEMSPLKTTYITTHGDSESLMTSSFYGNLPTEDEMIGRAEHVREFRKGRGYESFTEVGPNGERTERTYFYGSEDDPRSGRDRSRFVKTFYSEEGQQKEGEQPRFVHRYYASDIPEEETVEQTRFVQQFYSEETSRPESEGRFRFVETVREDPAEHVDFAKAIDEHVSTRGKYLGKDVQEDVAKYANGKPKDEASGSDIKPDEEKKDVIEGWGKPLGLPLPPKNINRTYAFPGQNISTTSTLSTPTDNSDSVSNWGHPMNLPSPAPPPAVNGNVETLQGKIAKETPKKEKKIQPKKNVSGDNKSSGTNTPNRRSESPVKQTERRTPSTGRSNKPAPNSYVYLDLTYVPHHGNSYYSNVEFFKKVRARYYVFSGTEPSKEVYNALLEAKQTWEDKKLEVTIIPTYDTDVLGYWVAENEETLAKHKIDLSPSASRCTINLQDHETSCSAYRLEF